jgi:hypothetical protein
MNYDYRNCASLFGYAASVHERSGAICELCDCGSGSLDFDLWRQMTVEHLIGESQGGYLRQIRACLADRFPDLDHVDISRIAVAIDQANTISACSFCNSTTSRDRNKVSMTSLIADSGGTEDEVSAYVAAALGDVLRRKRDTVQWKISAVRKAFEERVAAKLLAARQPS